jgi:hypothetical protein
MFVNASEESRRAREIVEEAGLFVTVLRVNTLDAPKVRMDGKTYRGLLEIRELVRRVNGGAQQTM